MAAFGANSSGGPFVDGTLQVAVPAAAAAAYQVEVSYLRVISPLTITAPASYAGPLTSYFDSQIASWYEAWQTTPLVTHDTATGYYTGIVPTTGSNSGALCFYPGNYPTALQLDQAISANQTSLAFLLTGADPATPIILTSDIWQCANTLASGPAGGAQLNVGKMIAAAFNRGFFNDSLLDDTTCQADVASFYPSGGTWNVWAQMFHAYSENDLAYGFPYDDVCGQNPSISLTATDSVTITLGPLT